MTVASIAVAMAVMTEARTVDVEQEGHSMVGTASVVWSDLVTEGQQNCVCNGSNGYSVK